MALTFVLACITTLAQSQTLVEMRDLSPREHRVAGFVLSTPQVLRVAAVGAEPRLEREDDERTTWPAAAWILDTRTREVVWDLRAAETERSRNPPACREVRAALPVGRLARLRRLERRPARRPGELGHHSVPQGGPVV